MLQATKTTNNKNWYKTIKKKYRTIKIVTNNLKKV
jgi:hypothetical protein